MLIFSIEKADISKYRFIITNHHSMITLFRKRRQRTLSESKFGKYLMYALGEIALLVIGILIALQINNENENWKNRRLVESYKENLIENLTTDSINIRENISKIKAELIGLQDYERRVATPISPLDTIVQIARHEYPFLIAGQFDYENDTYNVLISTGDIGLFTKEIISDLNALSNLQDFALFAQGQTFETYRNGLAQYGQNYPYTLRTNLIREGTRAADMIWEDISLNQHATQFNALIMAKGDAYRLSERELLKVLTKTTELLTKLR